MATAVAGEGASAAAGPDQFSLASRVSLSEVICNRTSKGEEGREKIRVHEGMEFPHVLRHFRGSSWGWVRLHEGASRMHAWWVLKSEPDPDPGGQYSPVDLLSAILCTGLPTSASVIIVPLCAVRPLLDPPPGVDPRGS